MESLGVIVIGGVACPWVFPVPDPVDHGIDQEMVHCSGEAVEGGEML